jgi:hypothetical protein
VIINDDLLQGNAERLFRSLRRLHRDLPVVITSRSGAEELANRHPGDNCVAALATPYTADELRQTLRELRVRCRGGGD